MSPRRPQKQSGQVMVLVAVALLALIGSAALMLLGGSVEWQKNQLQELADNTALDASLYIGNGCNALQAAAVIQEADTFLAGRRGAGSGLGIAGGPCSAPYVGTDTFPGPIKATINYPYQAHQQQVEVILTLSLPISFGSVEGIRNTNVTRRALAQAPAASVAALTATTIQCQANAQMNVLGTVVSRNLITTAGNCALYAHGRFDPVSRTWSDFGNVLVSRDGQAWVTAGGRCVAGAQTGASRYICADGYELSGTVNPACGTGVTEFQSAPDRILNPDPCAAGIGPISALSPPAAQLSPEPNLDPVAVATLRNAGGGPLGAACVQVPAVPYPAIKIAGVTIGTGLGPLPAVPNAPDAAGFYHFKPSCYGYLDISRLPTRKATFDPGFYYFNGSGMPGGGGVCLNATGQLVGRDITLEFVRTAVFNSGNCTGAGGGGGTFGARPCSSQNCPPNNPADGLNNTWLAAPCTTPPSPLDASSCRGVTSWCPVGDRSCWNQLVWAPAAITGRFRVDSTGARAWLLGTVSWPGTCLWGPNAASAIAGAVSCGTFQFAVGTSNLATIGSDAGVNTALSEGLLAE